VLQLGILVNEAFLEVDSFETNDIEVSDSDFGESDSENLEENVPVLSFFSDNWYINFFDKCQRKYSSQLIL